MKDHDDRPDREPDPGADREQDREPAYEHEAKPDHEYGYEVQPGPGPDAEPVVRVAAPVDPCNLPPLGDRDAVLIAATDPVVDEEAMVTAQQLAYVTAVGDGMQVFTARDELLRRWTGGAPYRFSAAANEILYCLHRSDDDLPAAERNALTASVFGVPERGLPPGTPVNRGFPAAFDRLLAELVAYREARCGCERRKSVTRDAVDLVAEQLRWDLQNHVTAATALRTRELRERLDRDVRLLSRRKVVAQVADDFRDGFWGVVASLLGARSAAAVNLVVLHEQARLRNDVFRWLTFEPGQGDKAAFKDAVAAAVVLTGTTTWTAASPGNGQRAVPDRRRPALEPAG